jgi:hypothetical protein
MKVIQFIRFSKKIKISFIFNRLYIPIYIPIEKRQKRDDDKINALNERDRGLLMQIDSDEIVALNRKYTQSVIRKRAKTICENHAPMGCDLTNGDSFSQRAWFADH